MGVVSKSPPAQSPSSGTRATISKKDASTDNDSSAAAARRKATGGTGLNDLFIVIFGLGFLLSLSMNILHSFERIPHAQHDTAIAAAVEEFKNIKPPITKKKQKEQHGSSRLGNKEQKEVQNGDGKPKPPPPHPDDHVHDHPQRGHEDALDHVEENNGGDHPAEIHSQGDPVLAHLSCKDFGGPDDEFAQEMVYWADIPSDANYMSPFHNGNKHESDRKYMTFEPDGGGWNNIRMAMESVIGLAVAMGRTLVMPPQKKM